MFTLYVSHPFGTFRVAPESSHESLDAALNAAFVRIATIVSNCRVWIEFNGESLVLMESN